MITYIFYDIYIFSSLELKYLFINQFKGYTID